MKLIKPLLIILITILFLGAVGSAKKEYRLYKDYLVTIYGTSNIHDWNEKVEKISGDCVVNWNDDGSFDLNTMNIALEVYSIKSENGSDMDDNTHEALKADKNPKIIFTLIKPILSIQPKSNENIISAKSNLNVAGVTKSIDMKVKVFIQKHGELTFEGTQTIKMTDYGVKPPEVFFGVIKTGNEITINFKTTFVYKESNNN